MKRVIEVLPLLLLRPRRYKVDEAPRRYKLE